MIKKFLIIFFNFRHKFSFWLLFLFHFFLNLLLFLLNNARWISFHLFPPLFLLLISFQSKIWLLLIKLILRNIRSKLSWIRSSKRRDLRNINFFMLWIYFINCISLFFNYSFMAWVIMIIKTLIDKDALKACIFFCIVF